ncbi:nucleoside triphosphate pyrophosphohydrolase [Marinimicrococcus flavescens]|uniref:Nucleoside triphosphate pyrophosphohydrolase n=1 Tax=Marinimicrococcus flavescens TaxID=3031815 RepID=A0AAP3XSD6_9PROT|nr:nucleoside triphosphate pyrophosphohydrolase [Marinimicrococcus flavescens]
MNAPANTTAGIERLLEVMRRLRDPEGGCPWDIEQDFSTIAPYTIEEAYEVADAIARQDWADLEGELGDLLLQVVYHARMAEEAGLFDFERVAHAIAEKMIARHPHVFGKAEIEDSSAQRVAWEETKAAERARKAAARGGQPSVLDDVPLVLPSLTRAEKLQKRAARAGFDWKETAPVVAKIREELDEVEQAVAAGDLPGRHEEMGDLLFAVANLARHLGVDPETALRDANRKFERRFRAVEAAVAAEGRRCEEVGLDELDRHWDEVKRRER